MVLNELGQKISAALAKVQNAEVVDDALIDACLKDISTALLQADVNVKQVNSQRIPPSLFNIMTSYDCPSRHCAKYSSNHCVISGTV